MKISENEALRKTETWTFFRCINFVLNSHVSVTIVSLQLGGVSDRRNSYKEKHVIF